MNYGKWIVIGEQFRKGKTHYYTPCKCECGLEKDIATSALKSGRSSGCHSCSAKGNNTTHGMVGTPIYSRWQSINSRCKIQKTYVDRGITVEWNTFEEFYADMGSTFNEEYQIDRRDNNGNYCKSNCRWIPQELNAGNKSNTSQYGVGIYKRRNKYLAKIENGGKVVYYEKFHDLDKAVKSRDAYIVKHHLNNKLNMEVA